MAAPATLTDNLCWLLMRASQALTTEMATALERTGLSPREHQVLVEAAAGASTQIELTRAVGLDKTTMVVTIDALERAGLAERRPHPADRRARVIAVTDAGRRKLAEAEAIHEGVRKDVLAALPRDERQAFVGSLKQLVDDRLAPNRSTQD